MLALARAAPKRVPGLCVGRVTVRSFAEVVGAPSGETSSTNPPPTLEGPNPTTPQGSASRQLTSKGKVPVREDHGLYGFFRKKDGTDLVGDARFDVVETPERMQHATGRSLN
jgi:large subunit ribosomal protein L47